MSANTVEGLSTTNTSMWGKFLGSKSVKVQYLRIAILNTANFTGASIEGNTPINQMFYINHQETSVNARFSYVEGPTCRKVVVFATRPIEAGEELFVHYGDRCVLQIVRQNWLLMRA
jgi:hypothetical protein